MKPSNDNELCNAMLMVGCFLAFLLFVFMMVWAWKMT